jgi:hypothetical protein
VRYIKRSLQREAPQGRILLAGAVFTVFAGLSLFDRATGIGISGDQVPLPLQIVFGSLALCVVALLFGMAYAAAEGEVRELHPGTMTSLDALLTGRLFTQNTGAAILLGMALGGWLLLSTQAASLLRQQGPVDLSEVEFAFARVPWLTALAEGAFQRDPQRFVRIPGAAGYVPADYPALVPALAAAGAAAASGPGFSGDDERFRPGGAVEPRVSGADAVGHRERGGVCSRRSSWLPTCWPAWRLWRAANRSGGRYADGRRAGLARSGDPAWARRRGCRWRLVRRQPGKVVLRDEEVRPLYASHLAERLRLEQEIDATRVAQRCLLPAAFPEASPDSTLPRLACRRASRRATSMTLSRSRRAPGRAAGRRRRAAAGASAFHRPGERLPDAEGGLRPVAGRDSRRAA